MKNNSEHEKEKVIKYQNIVNHLYDEMELDSEIVLEKHLNAMCEQDDKILIIYYNTIANELSHRGYVFETS